MALEPDTGGELVAGWIGTGWIGTDPAGVLGTAATWVAPACSRAAGIESWVASPGNRNQSQWLCPCAIGGEGGGEEEGEGGEGGGEEEGEGGEDEGSTGDHKEPRKEHGGNLEQESLQVGGGFSAPRDDSKASWLF